MKTNRKLPERGGWGVFLFQFGLVILSGVLLLLSYHWLINSFQNNQREKINNYLNQNEKIDKILSNPSSLTEGSIKDFDLKNHTNFSLALDNIQMQRTLSFQDHTIPNNPINKIVNAKIVEPLLLLKSKNLSKVSEIDEDRNGFWALLPSIPALVFGALGVFFTTIISNFAKSCYQGFGVLFKSFNF